MTNEQIRALISEATQHNYKQEVAKESNVKTFESIKLELSVLKEMLENGEIESDESLIIYKKDIEDVVLRLDKFMLDYANLSIVEQQETKKLIYESLNNITNGIATAWRAILDEYRDICK